MAGQSNYYQPSESASNDENSEDEFYSSDKYCELKEYGLRNKNPTQNDF